ncbi:hypothetical protein MASR1M68_13510 [Elusimicrobiota bacterium]
MRFIDKYFYMILLLFTVFLLFIISFWNIFIVPLHREISTNLSGLIAQEERILYSFFESAREQNRDPDPQKKQQVREIKETYKTLLYDDKDLWLKSKSFCKLEYEFMHNVENKIFQIAFIWFILFVSFLSLELANKVDLKYIFNKLILLVITTVLLIYVDSTRSDHSFYTLMKTAVFMTSFYFASGLIKEMKSNLFFWLFLITGIIFNPFFNLHFGEKSGLNINLYTAGLFVIYFIFLCLQNKKNKSLKKQF